MATTRDLIIIGAGPIGLEAALYASNVGLDFLLLERGDICANLKHWGFVKMFSPWEMNVSPLGRDTLKLDGADKAEPLTGADTHQGYYRRLAELEQLSSRTLLHHRVVAISRAGLLKYDYVGEAQRRTQPFRVLAETETGDRIFYARHVIDASGVYHLPNRLGSGGVPAAGETQFTDRIFYRLVDISRTARLFAGRSLLVVGGGHSAGTTMVDLEAVLKADEKSRVYWMTRSNQPYPTQETENDPLPERARVARRANEVIDRWPQAVRYLPGRWVEQIEPGDTAAMRVTFGSANFGVDSVEVDYILAHVGFRPNTEVFRELQVHLSYASEGPLNLATRLLDGGQEDSPASETTGYDLLQNPEPDFYIIGSKSYGRASSFLIADGIKQVRDCFRLITGDLELDLYAQAQVDDSGSR